MTFPGNIRIHSLAAVFGAMTLVACGTGDAAVDSGTQPLATADAPTRLAHAVEILKSVPLVDGHNDLPWAIREDTVAPMDVIAYDLRQRTRGHTDIARLREGHVGGQFWSVYVPGEAPDSGYARMQLEQIDIARRVIERYPDVLVPAYTAADVRKAFADGKIGSLLGMEGGHVLENSLGALRAYYDLGARYLTLTHNVTLDWADANGGPYTHGGLTEFGKEVVREMNRLGMLVDLSHVSVGTMSDALDVSQAPVIFSHSSAAAITNVTRNVPDSILKRLDANGGVVMVTFVPGFVSTAVVEHSAKTRAVRDSIAKLFPRDSSARANALAAWRQENPAPRATMDDVIEHLEHIRSVAGASHVGLGGDFDGITEVVQGLEDVSKYPDLFAALIARGWTDSELRGLAGENVLRALEGAEKVKEKLADQVPSVKTIRQLDGKQ